MRPVLMVALRELFSFFVSPIAYVVLTVWLLMQGLSLYIFAEFFAANQWEPGAVSQTPLTFFFGGSSIFYTSLLVIVPLLTMRLIAAERASGTLEPALTAPITERQYVAGKYLAAMGMWVTIWLPTLLYVWILSGYGDIDWGVVGSSYVGVMGVGVYYMALGLLMSAASRTQIVAGVLTFMAIGGLFMIGILPFVLDGVQAEIFSYLSIWKHQDDFAKGIIDSRHLVFDVSVAALALFLTVRILEGRRYE